MTTVVDSGGYESRLNNAYGRINMSYQGFIARQELVDHCKDMVEKIGSHVDNLEKARAISKDPKQIATFDEAITLHRGEQLGFRNVCEWAAAHLTEPEGKE